MFPVLADGVLLVAWPANHFYGVSLSANLPVFVYDLTEPHAPVSGKSALQWRCFAET